LPPAPSTKDRATSSKAARATVAQRRRERSRRSGSAANDARIRFERLDG
jgi:hypothetical protein